MRLSTRSRVDLPQPDGPMKAVTVRSKTGRLMPLRAWDVPIKKIQIADRDPLMAIRAILLVHFCTP